MRILQMAEGFYEVSSFIKLKIEALLNALYDGIYLPITGRYPSGNLLSRTMFSIISIDSELRKIRLGNMRFFIMVFRFELTFNFESLHFKFLQIMPLKIVCFSLVLLITDDLQPESIVLVTEWVERVELEVM